MRYIPYGRQSIDRSDISAVLKALGSDWITQGPKVSEFEGALRRYCRSKYAVAVSSGTAALHIACLAAGIKKDDEVITSPITFAASANSVLYCQGRPVFADIQPDTANIDPEEIRKKVSKKTRAIIPVHYAGYPCDMVEIKGIADKHGLIIIEDAAHALGAWYKKSRIGSCRYSDMAVFSFHPVKTITTGEGGAVLTNDIDLYKKLIDLRSHGIVKEPERFTGKGSSDRGSWYYEMQQLGFNYRITDFQCALGISQLSKIDKFINRRRKIAGIYDRVLSGIGEIEIPHYGNDSRSAYHLYYIRLIDKEIRSKKEQLFHSLRKNGIGVQVHYIPVYLHPYYAKLGYKKGACPKAERFYHEAISIPIHPLMNDKEVIYVGDVIKRILINTTKAAK